MTSTTTPSLPEAIKSQLPAVDQKSPFLEAETEPEADSQQWLIAGTHALYCFQGTEIFDAGMWYEVQYAKWNADNRRLTVVWIDPERPILSLTTEDENPASFMKILTSRVNRPIVLSRHTKTPSGAAVTASVRRRADGELFSSVIAQGSLGPGEETILTELEQAVRAELGLE